MRERISDKVRIVHITECADEIAHAISNHDYLSFSDNHVLRIAVVKWIEIIGEASANITEETKKMYPLIDWVAIKGMRNILVHEYFGIQYEIVWEAATLHVPKIKKELETILKDFE